MTRVLLIAGNVFRGIFHRRVLYLWFAAVALLLLQAAVPILFNFGSPAVQEYMRRRALSSGLGTWSSLSIALSIFMGASALGSEISGKTLVNVFARPIHRWELLAGKWLGVLSFTLLAFGAGLLVGFGLAEYLGAAFETRILGYAVAQTGVAIVLYSGLALAFSTVFTSGVAGALTVLVVFMPAAVEPLSEHESAAYRGVGAVLDYAVPPGYTSHYAGAIPALLPMDAFRGFGDGGGFGGRGFGRGRRGMPVFTPPAEAASPEIKSGEQTRMLLQNLGYAAVFAALGVLLFQKKDLRLG
jgi:hypothetical protein